MNEQEDVIYILVEFQQLPDDSCVHLLSIKDGNEWADSMRTYQKFYKRGQNKDFKSDAHSGDDRLMSS